MKKIKPFIVSELFIIIIKILGGIISHSYTMLSSSIYDISLIIILIISTSTKDNKKYKGIISSLISFCIILMSIGIVFFSIIKQQNKISLLVILFIVLSAIARYMVNCIYTNNNYRKKNGTLGISLISSNADFYNYGVILATAIIFKFQKWLPILKYIDIIGTILLTIFIIYKSSKIIINSFKYMEDNENIIEVQKNEIESCPELKKLHSIEIKKYGGIRKSVCKLTLKDGINMIDINSFVITLQDFMLKSSEISYIELIEDNKKVTKKKPKVRSLKQDARNSRSGNSKTNTKKKNTKKKNKKN